jgi:hypothetical protein
VTWEDTRCTHFLHQQSGRVRQDAVHLEQCSQTKERSRHLEIKLRWIGKTVGKPTVLDPNGGWYVSLQDINMLTSRSLTARVHVPDPRSAIYQKIARPSCHRRNPGNPVNKYATREFTIVVSCASNAIRSNVADLG